MKNKYFLILLVCIINISFSQDFSKKSTFSYLTIGVYGGFTTFDFAEYGEASLLEVRSNLVKNLLLNFSVGYYVNTEEEHSDVTDLSISFNKIQTSYKVIPISIGCTYFLNQGHSCIYLLSELNYNFIKSQNKYSNNDDNLNIISSGYEGSIGYTLGLGIYYNWIKRWKPEIKFLYKNNRRFKSVSQIIVGLNYLF